MQIVLLEPFFTGSHKSWAEQMARFSRHEVTILAMEGRFWKWRMHGGAVSLAEQFNQLKFQPDLILATDMVDLSSFLALTRRDTAHIPTAVYFHENQMAYPWGEKVVRNNNWRHYAFINYMTALSADHVFFNSRFHLQNFQQEIYQLLKCYPDYRPLDTVETIKAKGQVLPLGLNLKAFDEYKPKDAELTHSKPLIAWNHRWEHDKNPEDFARLLRDLHQAGFEFAVVLLGEAPPASLQAFDALQEILGERILHFGYAEHFADYAYWLWQADLLPVTSRQDFFGISVVEAIYCGCYPLLPNRLVYPDHVPSEQEAVLYDDYNELFEKMRYLLSDIEWVRQTNFQHWIDQYDWSEIINRYDETFEAIGKR